MKTKEQYYRDRKQYLVRLYCDCGSEMIYIGKTEYKFEHKCKGCGNIEGTDSKYPFWRQKKKKNEQ